MRKKWITVGVCAMIFAGVSLSGMTGAASSDTTKEGQAFACDAATLNGTYGVQMQGLRPVLGGPVGTTEPFFGVALRTYDGVGGFTQIDNVKGPTGPFVPDRPGSGTYVVNANCTAVVHFEPAPGIVIEERMVIVGDGREVRSMVSFSSPFTILATAVQQRIDRR